MRRLDSSAKDDEICGSNHCSQGSARIGKVTMWPSCDLCKTNYQEQGSEILVRMSIGPAGSKRHAILHDVGFLHGN